MRYVKKKMVEPGRPHMTIWHLHRARWITVATGIHSEYVILIGLLLQQWLHECASMLRFTYTVCLV